MAHKHKGQMSSSSRHRDKRSAKRTSAGTDTSRHKDKRSTKRSNPY